MEPVCRRLIEQFVALKKCFLVSLQVSKDKASIYLREKYKRIRKSLEDPLTPIYLNHIAFLTPSFSEFFKLFQKLEPLVHILCEKLNEQVVLLMQQIINTEIFGNKKASSYSKLNVISLKIGCLQSHLIIE